jgi:hypothetical protein
MSLEVFPASTCELEIHVRPDPRQELDGTFGCMLSSSAVHGTVLRTPFDRREIASR